MSLSGAERMASELTSILAELTIAAEEVVKILDKFGEEEGHEEEGSPMDKLRKAIARAADAQQADEIKRLKQAVIDEREACEKAAQELQQFVDEFPVYYDTCW